MNESQLLDAFNASENLTVAITFLNNTEAWIPTAAKANSMLLWFQMRLSDRQPSQYFAQVFLTVFLTVQKMIRIHIAKVVSYEYNLDKFSREELQNRALCLWCLRTTVQAEF